MSKNINKTATADATTSNYWGFDAHTRNVMNKVRLTNNPYEVLIGRNIYTFQSAFNLFNMVNDIPDFIESNGVSEVEYEFRKSSDFRTANEEDFKNAMTIYDAIINAIEQNKVEEESYVGYTLDTITDQVEDMLCTNSLSETSTLEDVKKVIFPHSPEPWEYFMSGEEITKIMYAFLNTYYYKCKKNI